MSRTAQMGPLRFLFILLWGCLAPLTIEAKIIPNLRRFRINAVGGLFKVDRKMLEEELWRRKRQGAITDHASLSLATADDDCSSTTASLMVSSGIIEDYTLQEQLPDELSERVATSYYHIHMMIPFTSNNQQGMMYLAQFTNESRLVFFPYSTNHRGTQRVESIQSDDEGNIVMRNGTDLMVIKIVHGEECRKSSDRKLLDHIDDVTGKDFIATDYPHPFDWGCDLFQSQNVTFCDILNDQQCEIDQVSPDVCTTLSSTSQSHRCSASMQILQITGGFKEMFPYLTPSSKSFMGEWADREHGEGIIFPCLSDSE